MGTVVLMWPNLNPRSKLRPDTGISPPRRICRRLFQDGPQSKVEALNALQREGENDAMTKWNFDFRAGVPLPGRYQWVPVQIPNSDAGPEAVTQECPVAVTRHNTKQSKITDFMRKRKATDSPNTDLSSKWQRKQLDCGLT